MEDGFAGMAGMSELDMDPEMMKFLLEAYGDQLQSGEVDDKIAQARALRGYGMNQPSGRQAGRVYVAQNPLETLASTMIGLKGIGDERSQMAERERLNRAQGQRVSSYAQNLFGKPKGPFDYDLPEDYVSKPGY